METTAINATQLRTRTRDVIERARFKGERIVIHTFGKPVAVILGFDEYMALIQVASPPLIPASAAVPDTGTRQAPLEQSGGIG